MTDDFIFQDYNLLPPLTVEQNVVLPLRLAGRRTDGNPVAASYADTVVSRGSMS